MKVKDEDGNVGIITLCKDIHNISVYAYRKIIFIKTVKIRQKRKKRLEY